MWPCQSTCGLKKSNVPRFSAGPCGLCLYCQDDKEKRKWFVVRWSPTRSCFRRLLLYTFSSTLILLFSSKNLCSGGEKIYNIMVQTTKDYFSRSGYWSKRLWTSLIINKAWTRHKQMVQIMRQAGRVRREEKTCRWRTNLHCESWRKTKFLSDMNICLGAAKPQINTARRPKNNFNPAAPWLVWWLFIYSLL